MEDRKGLLSDGRDLEAKSTKKASILVLPEFSIENETWHYAFLLPVIDEKDRKTWEAPMDDPVGAAEKIFTLQTREKMPAYTGFKNELEKTGISKMKFHELARKIILEILTGKDCGFDLGTQESIDKDQLFLLIGLNKEGAQQQLADNANYRCALSKAAWGDLVPPSTSMIASANGMKFASANGEKYGKSHVSNYVPPYVPFSKSKEQNWKARGKTVPFHMILKDKDLIRIVRKRLREFMSLDNLIHVGICEEIFPMHTWKQDDINYGQEEYEDVGLDDLALAGWNDPLQFYQWPGQNHVDKVRDYFGEEVGFFFHWWNFYCRFMLLFPAPVGLCLFILEQAQWPSYEKRVLMRLAFAGMMCIWSSVFTKCYNQRCNYKVMQWGMKSYEEVASVRRAFSAEYRHSWKNKAQHVLHWSLVFVFIVETLVVVFYLSGFQSMALKHEKETPGKKVVSFCGLMMTGKMASKIAKYLVTINIMMVDKLWTFISVSLSDMENWRTDQELKQAKVLQLFAVKIFTYYYPFWYTAFIKKHVEGCPETDDPTASSAQGCVDELNSNLMCFFFTSIFTSLLGIFLPIASTWWEVYQEKKKAAAGRTFSYVEIQAKCPAFVNEADDFLELIVSFGFVCMFSCTLPFMAFLAACASMVSMRLTAYRLCYVNQRSTPRGQEGLGIWATLVEGLSFLGVLTNVGIGVFVLPPMSHMSQETQIITFLAVEHAMIGIKFLISTGADKEVNQIATEEYMQDNLNGILWDVCQSDVSIQPTKAPAVPLTL